eukprot:TRINITY_DN21008_c0_g1_i1.p1 TRINITY_DN21008_c0_g1~~TRINITY_DN21008_c0_g1_i1.p1  ORF type:complete len:168 (+),score=40.51 TRINITY_DN21008_c0_g1_i1:215-718(+)
MSESAAGLKAVLEAQHFEPGRNKQGNKPVMYSTGILGAERKEPLQDTAYWHDQMLNPVHYHSALCDMVENEGITHLVEVSPHPVLQAYCTDPPMYPTAHRNKNELKSISKLLSTLFECHAPVSWAGNTPHVAMPQPSYLRKKCWALHSGNLRSDSLTVPKQIFSWDA